MSIEIVDVISVLETLRQLSREYESQSASQEVRWRNRGEITAYSVALALLERWLISAGIQR